MSLILLYVYKLIGYMVIAFPFYIIGRFVYIKRKKQQASVGREFLLGFFFLYIIAVASQTIIPKWDAGIISSTGEFYFNVQWSNKIASVNIIPFRTLFLYLQANPNIDNWSSLSMVNIFGNMFVFTPIGIFVPLLYRRLRSLKKILIVALVVTCFIEITQLFIGRSTDIDDVILNTIGVMIGYGMFAFVNSKINRSVELKEKMKKYGGI